jgi:Leucine-rich repeat (LRR) protein
MGKFLLTLLVGVALATTSLYAMNPPESGPLPEKAARVSKTPRPQQPLPEKAAGVSKTPQPQQPLPRGIAALTENLMRSLISYSERRSIRVMARSSRANIDRIARNIEMATSCDIPLTRLITMTNLTSLNLSYNEKITIDALTSLFRLTSLNLSYEKIITNDGLSSLFRLTSLNLSCNKNITNDGLTPLFRLTSLNLSRNKKITIDALLSLSHLTILDLSYNKKITSIDLMKLSGLKDLSLKENKIADEDPSQITILTNLTRLDFSGSRGRGTALEHFPCLTDLELRRTGAINAELSKLTLLKKLVVPGDTSVSDRDLTTLTNLEILDIGGNKSRITSKSVSKLTNLRFLNCSHNSGITTAALEALPNLERVDITGCSQINSTNLLKRGVSIKNEQGPSGD